MKANPVFLVVIILVAVQTAMAGDKPNFSGTWVLNKSRSNIQVERLANMDRGVFVIEHNEPRFKVTRTFTIDGKNNTLGFEYLTDGKEVAKEEQGMKSLATMRWDGDTIVFITRFILPDEEVTNAVRYTLLDAGKTLQADEKVSGKKIQHHNIWIFDKQ